MKSSLVAAVLGGVVVAMTGLWAATHKTSGGVATAAMSGEAAPALPAPVVVDLLARKVKKTESEWRSLLSREQFDVTRKAGTERPFANAYWDNHADGVYFSICSDTPLFDSRDKFESGTGWPSFTKPVDPRLLDGHEDTSFGMVRDEVRCSIDGAHLGHVFDDGPRPTGKRYCINSAALRFVPRQDYEAWVAARTQRAEASKASPAGSPSQR